MDTEILMYIRLHPYALLVTVGENYTPFARYIGPLVITDNALYFFTKRESQKAVHLETNPEVILYFQNPLQCEQKYRGVVINGTATCIRLSEDYNCVLEKLGEISPGYRDYLKKDGFTKYAAFKVAGYLLQSMSTDFSSPPRIVTQKMGKSD